MVLDIAQRTWHFKDDASKIFRFKNSEVCSFNNLAVKKSPEVPEEVTNFLSWFENSNKNNEYSPGFTNKIFAGTVPENIDVDIEEAEFPPMKRLKTQKYYEEIFQPIELNSIQISLRSDEATDLQKAER